MKKIPKRVLKRIDRILKALRNPNFKESREYEKIMEKYKKATQPIIDACEALEDLRIIINT